MSDKKDEYQQALDTLIALETACGEARIPEKWYTPRINRAHVLIRDKRNYPELRAILIELVEALQAKEKRRRN